MTHTFTKSGRTKRYQADKHVRGSLNITSYTNAGETLAASTFGMKRIDRVIVEDGASDEGYIWRYAGGKVRAYGGDATDATVTVTDGVGRHTKELVDVNGGSDAAQSTTSATPAVNAAFVIAAAAADGTALTTIAAEPNTSGAGVIARNLTFSISSSAGGTLPADSGTLAVVGTDKDGNADSETVSLAALNSVAITAGHSVWAIGTKPFATVTSVTPSVDLTASVADAELSVGIGTRFALDFTLDTPAASDVKVVKKNTANVGSGTYSVSTATNSVKMGADLADDDDIVIEYAIDADTASGALTGAVLSNSEATSTTDVGAANIYVIGA